MIPEGVVRTAAGHYVLRDDTLLSRWIERSGTLDVPENREELDEYLHLIPAGGIVIDAGAFVGDHAAAYSQRVGPTGGVYAFEPHPLAYRALELNMGPLMNVVAWPLALSDRIERKWLQPQENASAGFVADTGRYDITCTSLDEFFGMRLSRCDFVHLDAEGYETRILRGAKTFIKRYRPMMSIEVCDKQLQRAGSSENELLEEIEALGYDVVSHSPCRGLHNDLCMPRKS